MRKISNFFVYIIGLLLLSNIVHAQSFNAKVVPIKDKIVVDEVAEFNITITNYLPTAEEFTIKKTGYPFWDMYIKPLQNPISLNVPGNGSASLKLFVRPLYITSVDTYTLDTGIVLGRAGEEQKVPVTIGIKSTEPLIQGYIPTVLASASITPEKIDPREAAKVKIVLSNQNVINYTNLTLKIEGDLINQEIYFPLSPKDDKTIEIIKKFDDILAPQVSRITITVLKDERPIVSPTTKEFEIAEYAVRQNIPAEQSFLKIRKGIRVITNNPDYKGSIKIETSPFKNLFLTTSPRADTVKENGKYYLEWQISVNENKTASAYTTENYRPIVVVIALIIIAVILYFMFRSPIVVRKGIANVGMSEGGISEAKVVVRVKNRSSKQIANIEVLDHLPHIASVEKELSIGSMQPHAVMQHPKKGIIIKWNIETLEPGDERVLSYRMKSRLSILGEFNLPSASARTKIGNKVIITNSNRVSVGG